MCIKNARMAMGRKLNRQGAKAQKNAKDKIPPRFF
jgi:hypothetical protein